MKRSKTIEKRAAVLTVFRPAEMTVKGRREIAKWLRRQAEFLVESGNDMAKKFTARYLYK